MATYPLRTLEARFQKVITNISTEKDAEGKYVFRDDNGQVYFWSTTPEQYGFQDVETLAEADHIMFLCPLCFEKNGGNVGTHDVMVTFAGRTVPDGAGSRGADGKPTRWSIAGGSGLDDLSLSPSIALNQSSPPDQGCHWHGWVGSSGIPPGHAG